MNVAFFGYEASVARAIEQSLGELGESVLLRPARRVSAGLVVSAGARPDVVLLKQEGSDSEYLELLLSVLRFFAGTPVIGLTTRRSVELAVEAMRAGMADLVVMDGDYARRLARSLKRVRNGTDGTGGVGRTAPGLAGSCTGFADLPRPLDAILGESRAIRDLKERAERVMKLDVHVLIRGETGTGKELLARALHFGSPRRRFPFVPVNCAALPPELVESELFGHEKGAFTGACSRRVGKVMEANHGTLFLDEVGDLPVPMQAKFLRLLQEGEIQRVGADRPVVADVRVVAATNRRLELLAQEGAFRSDLYHRLNAISLAIPPLRERGQDILLLARILVERFAAELGRPAPALREEAQAELMAYPWRGNFRELENVIRRELLFCDGDVIGSFGLGNPRRREDAGEEEGELLDVGEGDRLAWLLRRYRGNLSRVARHLQVSRPTAYKRIYAHGLELADFR